MGFRRRREGRCQVEEKERDEFLLPIKLGLGFFFSEGGYLDQMKWSVFGSNEVECIVGI